jgi:hypothetical protein
MQILHPVILVGTLSFLCASSIQTIGHRLIDVQNRFKPDADIQDPSTNPVDEVAGETARLRKALVDAIVGGYLPSYDQRKYDNVSVIACH